MSRNIQTIEIIEPNPEEEDQRIQLRIQVIQLLSEEVIDHCREVDKLLKSIQKARKGLNNAIRIRAK